MNRNFNQLLPRLFSWGILVVTIMYWVLISVAGDRWWPATFFLFAPRWMLTLPIVLLIPFSLCKSRLLLLPLITALALVLGPIMGFTFPAGKGSREPSKPSLRIVSCNLQNGKFDSNEMDALIRDTQPDIVALQELPAEIVISSLTGWNHICEGDVHIYARFPLTKGDFRKARVPQHIWPRTCFLYGTVETPLGDIRLCTVHLPSPRYGLQNILDRRTVISSKRKKLLIDETDYRRQASDEISSVVAVLTSPKIIVGDFNMPVESAIYHDYWGDYQNAFSKLGTGYGWTERASVRGIPVGIRIDHILLNETLIPLSCRIGPGVGSDHFPIIADISLLQ